MKFHDVDFDTYFRNYPDANGYFGMAPPTFRPSCRRLWAKSPTPT